MRDVKIVVWKRRVQDEVAVAGRTRGLEACELFGGVDQVLVGRAVDKAYTEDYPLVDRLESQTANVIDALID